MKKHKQFIIFVLLIILSICTLPSCNKQTSKSCQHQWVNADCLYPQTCRLCNETHGEALGHDFTKATCTEHQTCIRCNLKEGKALGHTEVVDKAVTPTCTTAGRTEGKHCLICDEVLVAQQIISPLGHDWGNPTCTTPRSCCVCYAIDQNSEPLNHHYIQGECIICGDDDPDYTSPITADKTFITLHGDSDIVYITVSTPSTVVWDTDNTDIINCQWGDWDGDTIPLIITPVSGGDTLITVFNQYSYIQINVTVEEHTPVNGICTQCNAVVDAYYALSYYVLNNGEEGNDDWYYIKTVFDEENSFYIFTNTDMSSLSFVYSSYASGQEVYTEIYLNSDNNKYADVYFELTSSSSVDSATGYINSTTYSENNQYIYDYQYFGDYPSLSSKFKEIFNSYIDLTLDGIALFTLPEQFTMEMFGFDNY